MKYEALYEGAKLTKKFFMELPAGVYLTSGIGDSPKEPCFAEYVVPGKIEPSNGREWGQFAQTGDNARSSRTAQHSIAMLPFGRDKPMGGGCLAGT